MPVPLIGTVATSCTVGDTSKSCQYTAYTSAKLYLWSTLFITTCRPVPVLTPEADP